MSIKRNHDWPEKLHEKIQELKQTPFSWGGQDCCLFVADCVLAMTGTDLAVEYRGKYTDEAGAAAVMVAIAGGPTVEDVMVKAAKDYNLKEVPVLMAQRGDILLFELSTGKTLGIVSHDGIHALASGKTGLERLRVKDATRAWRTS
jgi:hypothetical protein